MECDLLTALYVKQVLHTLKRTMGADWFRICCEQILRGSDNSHWANFHFVIGCLVLVNDYFIRVKYQKTDGLHCAHGVNKQEECEQSSNTIQ